MKYNNVNHKTNLELNDIDSVNYKCKHKSVKNKCRQNVSKNSACDNPIIKPDRNIAKQIKK